MRDLDYDQGRRLSSHAFRKGATDEIKNPGPTFATILTSGLWSPGGFRFYLGLHADEAVNISALLIKAIDSESDDPGEAGKPSNPDAITKRLRKRLPPKCLPPPPSGITQKQPPKKLKAAKGDGDLESVNSETSYTSS